MLHTANEYTISFMFIRMYHTSFTYIYFLIWGIRTSRISFYLTCGLCVTLVWDCFWIPIFPQTAFSFLIAVGRNVNLSWKKTVGKGKVWAFFSAGHEYHCFRSSHTEMIDSPCGPPRALPQWVHWGWRGKHRSRFPLTVTPAFRMHAAFIACCWASQLLFSLSRSWGICSFPITVEWKHWDNSQLGGASGTTGQKARW